MYHAPTRNTSYAPQRAGYVARQSGDQLDFSGLSVLLCAFVLSFVRSSHAEVTKAQRTQRKQKTDRTSRLPNFRPASN